MRQSTGRKSSAWFWVGVVLLYASALWWLIAIATIVAEPEYIVEGIIGSLIVTVIPIGIGVYCIRRGKKGQAREVQQSVYRIKDEGSKIVIRLLVLFYVAAWILLLFGVGLVFGVVLVPAALMEWAGDPSGANGEIYWIVGTGLFLVLLGIWMVGITTKITFNQPPGYMTVTLGMWPLFLWFLRTKRISKEDARSAFVRSGEPASWHTAYQARVVMESGKEVTLVEDGNPSVSNYLVRRILEFSRQ